MGAGGLVLTLSDVEHAVMTVERDGLPPLEIVVEFCGHERRSGTRGRVRIKAPREVRVERRRTDGLPD